MYRILATTGAMALLFTLPAHAALVGTLSKESPTITFPVAFNANADVFNSFSDVPGGLSFAIAPGNSAPVRLEVLEGSKNIRVVAAAIDSAFAISQTLPLSITTVTALDAGVHAFSIGAVTSGQSEGALVGRLTLTPIPGALLLALSGIGAIGGLAIARHRQVA